jgi:hypothetical protein
MRYILLLAMILAGFSFSATTSAVRAQTRSDRAVITKKTAALIHRAKDGEGAKTATVKYPLVTGIEDPLILKKIRSALSFKRVFGQSLAEMRAEFEAEEDSFTWLDGIDYTVNYNRRFILDITFTIEGTGAYPSSNSVHRLIDLRTGEIIKARHAFRPALLRQLAAKVDQKMQQAIEEVKEGSRKELEAFKNSQDSKSYEDQAVYDEMMQNVLENKRFTLKSLDNFRVDDRGVTFLYDFNMPHVILAMEPDNEYFFSWSELKPYLDPAGVLKGFLGGAGQTKKP